MRIFSDNKKFSAMLKNKYPFATIVHFKKNVSQDDIAHISEKTVLFAASNQKLQEITALCRNFTEKEIYVLPYDNGFSTAPIPIDAAKPRLDYLECDVSHVCNLNCKGCANFSSLSTGNKFYNIDQFKTDLLKLKDLFWGIAKIRLLGGEPLLHPDLPAYAEIARDVFPDCDLRIVTNGLLIPSLSDTALRQFRELGCGIEISAYKPTLRMRKEIDRKLQGAQIDYLFSVPMRIFFKTILSEPHADGNQAFQNCMFSNCHMLMENELAPCSYACCIRRLNRRFGTNYPENDSIDLSGPLPDGWKIIAYFSNPHELCRYCSTCPVPMRWQGNRPTKNTEKTDWLVKDGFFLRYIAGNMFKLIKKSAEALRTKTQQR